MAVLACANRHGGKSYGFITESNFGEKKQSMVIDPSRNKVPKMF